VACDIEHSNTHKWHEGLKTTWDCDHPLALFKVQLGHSDTHKWHEDLKTTWAMTARWLSLVPSLGTRTPIIDMKTWRSLRVMTTNWLFSRFNLGTRILISDVKIWISLCKYGWCSGLLFWREDYTYKSGSRDSDLAAKVSALTDTFFMPPFSSLVSLFCSRLVSLTWCMRLHLLLWAASKGN